MEKLTRFSKKYRGGNDLGDFGNSFPKNCCFSIIIGFNNAGIESVCFIIEIYMIVEKMKKTRIEKHSPSSMDSIVIKQDGSKCISECNRCEFCFRI